MLRTYRYGKSINGLMTLVKDSFLLDPFLEALFVFCNRN